MKIGCNALFSTLLLLVAAQAAATVATGILVDELPVSPADYCTMKAHEEKACVSTQESDGKNCVWCAAGSFGVCVNEGEAQVMKKLIPGIHCDEHDPTDDAAPPEPTAPPTGNDPTWKCLAQSDQDHCNKSPESCTWCMNKAGFGLCLAPVEAEFAKNSSWFHCFSDDQEASHDSAHLVATKHKNVVMGMDDEPCMAESLQQDESLCTSTTDASSGKPCEWCHMKSAPQVHYCLSAEQVAATTTFMSCQTSKKTNLRLGSYQAKADDPLDTTCLMASLAQDESACEATTDSAGSACKYCSVPSLPLYICLSQEQVDQVGDLVSCADNKSHSAVTNADTASTTTTTTASVTSIQDPLDTTCLQASLQQDESICKATTDDSGEPCEYCSLATVPLFVCLSQEQAQLAGDAVSCQSSSNSSAIDTSAQQVKSKLTSTASKTQASDKDPLDTTCLQASLQQDESICEATTDDSGEACLYCSLASVPLFVCLSQEQAQLAGDAVSCNNSTNPITTTTSNSVDFPPNMIKCLKNTEEGQCENATCSWCDTTLGLGVCLPNEAAAAVDDCPFFDCKQSRDKSQEKPHATKVVATPYDVTCWAAGMNSADAHTDCQNTLDHEGSPCVWCDVPAASGFGLCLGSEQAKIAGEWLQCDTALATKK